MHGDPHKLAKLLEKGVDPNFLDDDQCACLHWAARNGHLEVVSVLLAHRADVNIKDHWGCTPLHYASRLWTNSKSRSTPTRKGEIARLLIVNGADINSIDRGLTTPLHYAIMHGLDDVACLLIQHGADVRARDINKGTPLHMISDPTRFASDGLDYPKLIPLLMDHGADPSAKNNFQQQALDWYSGDETVRHWARKYLPEPPAPQAPASAHPFPASIWPTTTPDASPARHQGPVRGSSEVNAPQASASSSPVVDWRRELHSLIGLNSVKAHVEKIASLAAVNRQRRLQGINPPRISMHCVFTGNPGTGKTTVARLFGAMLRDSDILKSGHVHEVSRADIVAKYVGHTAPLVREACDTSLDGVLFIDEAYSLVYDNSPSDFGGEAIAELLKMMEDRRDRLVVIAAGYKNKMDEFVTSNPGLESRFTHFIHFDDFLPEELCRIFMHFASESHFLLDHEAELRLEDIMRKIHANRGANFGNARNVRKYFESVVQSQGLRLHKASRNNSRQELISITAADLSAAIDF